MKKIYLVNTRDYPTKGTHYLMSMKFINGFSLYGLETYSLETFDGIEDSDEQIFLVCDNFYDQRTPNWMDDFDYLAKKFEKTTWIFWTFHNVLNNHYQDRLFPFKKYIFTGEYYRNPDFTYFGEHFREYVNHPNYVALPFAASINPSNLDAILSFRTDVYDCGFSGCKYKEQWSKKLSENFNCYIHYWPPFLEESERISNAFLASKICLGFNSDDNIRNGLPTERVFEGIAYGCVVLTDCEMAVEATDGVAVYVSDYDDLEEKVQYYLTNEDARKEKQRMGYEFAKNKGTYYNVVKDFLNSIQKLQGN